MGKFAENLNLGKGVRSPPPDFGGILKSALYLESLEFLKIC